MKNSSLKTKKSNSSSANSEIRYRQLFETAQDGLIIVEAASGVVEDVNPSLVKLLGYSRASLVGKKFSEAGPFKEFTLHPFDFDTLPEGEPVNFGGVKLRAKGGRPVEVEFTCSAYRVGGQKIVQCSIRDISQQKLADQSLRLQSAALNAAASAIMITDREGFIEWVNPAFTHLTGYFFEETIGKKPGELLKSGLQDQAFYQKLWETVLVGKIWRSELINHRKDGSIYYEEETITPLKNTAGDVSHFIAIKVDITHRREAEAQIQRHLDHLTALSSIDKVIASNFDLKLNLAQILDHVITELDVDTADILVLNPHSHLLEYGAGSGFNTEAIKDVQIRLGEGFAGQAVLDRKRVEFSGATVADMAHEPHLSGEDFISYYAEPLIAKGQAKGVLEVYKRSSFQPDRDWSDFLAALAGQTAIAIDNSNLFESLTRSNSELAMAYDATIEGWSCALDLRDRETEGHTQRVTEMTMKLSRFMGLSEAELVHVRWGSLLHDIGKMGIADDILRKSGPLTEAETEEMKRHPLYAFDMLAPIRYLHDALDIPYCHHEKWDGTATRAA